eukprot:TRINITY_DN1952_c0_g1_i3.p1 TRINITY_DN1952_c0_g1~~TRINITY_DN1952_c0_g1_i3.p1  ORF type:complete len:260 (+),score=74.23 TRINITY_DN1952_c0_g1_i3:70-849(+)
MKFAAAAGLLTLSALHNAGAVQLISHRLHESNIQGHSSVLTHADNATHVITMLQAEFKHELELQSSAPVVNKIYLALIVQLGLGYCGIDRCFLGQMMLGACKLVTCGGCGIWAMVDYVILTVACLLSWKSVDMAYLRADFKDEHNDTAFWITVVAVVFYMFSYCYMACFWSLCMGLTRAMLGEGVVGAPSAAEIEKTFASVDTDHDCLISQEELLAGKSKLGSSATDEEIIQSFKKHASGGKLTFAEAEALFKELAEKK